MTCAVRPHCTGEPAPGSVACSPQDPARLARFASDGLAALGGTRTTPVAFQAGLERSNDRSNP